jgi:glutathione reductase (NADPH)
MRIARSISGRHGQGPLRNRIVGRVKTYDLAVIGGGSGGVRAARIAATLGARVVLAEEHRVGGTCVIRGCVPKKLLVYASRAGMDIQDGRGFGWTFEGSRFSWPDLITNVNAEVSRLEGAYTKNLLAAGVRVASTRATLLGAGRVKLHATDEVIEAKHILVATGARPAADETLPGWNLCITSDEVFTWERQPRRVVIQGAGYIALEFASLLARLGSEVTVLLRGSHILRGFDDEARRHLQSELQAANVRIVPQQTPLAVTRAGSHLSVSLSDGSCVTTDAVIRALGRRPNVRDLGLEAAGVRTDAQGAITVDELFRTTATGVYAVGDVTNPVQLTPVAIREGHIFAQTVFGQGINAGRSSVIPTAIFTTPEFAAVGLTEEQAVARHGEVDVFVSRFRPMKATVSGRSGQCLFKIIVNRADDRILGVHLVGPEAAEMIQLLSVAVNLGVRKADLDATLPVHPTLAEELVTLRVPTRRHTVRSEAPWVA